MGIGQPAGLERRLGLLDIGALDEVLVVSLFPHAVVEGDHLDIPDLVFPEALGRSLLRLGGSNEGDGLGEPECRISTGRAEHEIAA